MSEELNVFVFKGHIDYQKQRDSLAVYLKSRECENIEEGLDIYDDIISYVDGKETYFEYSFFHDRLKLFNDKLKVRFRLFIEDDGDNALFTIRSVFEDGFTMKFYTEFKSIHGDVEKMRIARIARKVIGIEE